MCFRLIKFQPCLITGSTQIEYQFCLASDMIDRIYSERNEYPSREAAISVINSKAKAGFISFLEKFVEHKTRIFEGTPREADCIKCRHLVKQLIQVNIFQAVRDFIKHEKEFQDIIPSPSNPSYESSKQKLCMLHDFAHYFINLKLS